MKDRDYLIWLHSRLETVHGERSIVDYMHKLRAVITAIPADQDTPNDGRGKNGLPELEVALEKARKAGGKRTAIARRGEDLGETLVWHRSFTELPDDDTTVLVQSPNGSEPVWPGFHDERGWHHVENAVATITATAWAEMPTGPIA